MLDEAFSSGQMVVSVAAMFVWGCLPGRATLDERGPLRKTAGPPPSEHQHLKTLRLAQRQ